MNQKRIFIGLVAVVVIGVLLWWWLSFPKATPTAEEPNRIGSTTQAQNSSSVPAPKPPIEERRKGVVEKILGVLATPISFYGKVIDQNGDPVPNANIGYGVLDKFNASGSNYTNQADKDGFFSITGINGAVLTVVARKDGYYHIHNVSNQSFAYGMGPDSNTKPPPTKEDPAIFVLHKMGETEPMVRVDPGGIRVPKNGTPTEIDLTTGYRVQNSQRSLRVEAWTENDGLPTTTQPYNWRCRVSIPGGGLVERTQQFDFQAPETGYREFDEVEFKKDDPSWQSRFDKDYFAQLPDGTYARFKFGFRSGGEHFFRLESYLNPKSGSRNLEFDPNKVVKSQ